MANTARLGSTTDPSKTASVRVHAAEEYDTRANCDPDKLLQCPFDKNHQIRSSRFPYHIIKCRKNHPKLASQLKSCPFNARHLVPNQELQAHIETCPDRIVLDSEEAGNDGNCKWKVPVSTWENTNLTEDWETEVDDYAPPFILGRRMENEKSTSKKTDFKPAPAFKTPNTLPWTADF
ncbi:gametocyte-specific factor 1 [Takifugu rubripes]|uniref:CHHC U11-48K-type domain-containing protein n=2 Tax=Takifugu TaxID=31032 RepID=H2US04_TAKRU|nr:gametocyte-specific factor 1-like [Takifugu rubripes]XP_056896695.1 gametocyte-specific factor 1 [Takifugu flavidus]TNM86762.1 hypothetical protein fugu_006992 [Takifugu bimaculatus]|eukprot:XP_011601017.1 PREDICTED: gametocyte-specific factor 1-like [Takifugu rubripes]